MTDPGAIYGLAHEGTIRYVGRTKLRLSSRLLRHLREARDSDPGKRHVFDWIRSVGFRVDIVLLEKDPPDLNQAEKAWIATLRRYGCDLTNIAEGGAGAAVRGRTPWNKGRKGVAPETRAKMSAAARARTHRPPVTEETRRKRSAALKGHPKLIESGRRIGLMMGGRQFTEESRRKAGESNRLRWQNYTPEERAKLGEAISLGKQRAKLVRQGGDA